ncbi:cytochrome-c oxidase, cbb3-type subunit II [Suttonella sp. R2A3]|uniref:cytochrome-c oxidase, cbb3-type subunit II n=1 Tax=Suttonella sp. R2A3 TaxID=2908648 RepID=UPI001F2983F4|nr:cytochrome-c oxidase, cbb3-type subunit II [Suttonella sp. R2A3]UJF25455.1 cytochrome-c oxidase, cbb3-type subunit II [Suttonella sp. R2A3]
MGHAFVEKSIVTMGLLILLAVIWGGIVQILPLPFDKTLTTSEYVKPYDPLRLAGFNTYIEEGCYGCHSQMIRPFRWETERYGHYSVAEESIYDRPFQWGSKRTGPDLARIGGKYANDWHVLHLLNPRNVVPQSNMPAYPWLAETPVDVERTVKSMRTKMALGEPYTEEDIAAAAAALEGKTKMDAVVAYLQGLGVAFQENR